MRSGKEFHDHTWKRKRKDSHRWWKDDPYKKRDQYLLLAYAPAF